MRHVSVCHLDGYSVKLTVSQCPGIYSLPEISGHRHHMARVLGVGGYGNNDRSGAIPRSFTFLLFTSHGDTHNMLAHT